MGAGCVMAVEKWTWFPPGGGEPLEWDGSQGIRVRSVDGIGANAVRAQTHKAPFQMGRSLIDVEVNERVIEFELILVGTSREDLLAKRRLLSRAMAMSTV